MNKLHNIFLPLLCLFAIACGNADQKTLPELKNLDTHTYAQPERAVVKHLYWDAVIHFDERLIDATAHWKVEVQPHVTEIIFDSHRLSISGVQVNGENGTWNVGKSDPLLGTEIIIPVEASEFQREMEVSITYRTPNSAKALFWAEPGQTYDKKHPFLFTQSQAILARSWIPCQDSPGIRFTYDAKVKVPEGYLALMSAENPQSKNSSGVYEFKMTQSIPSYLMALAVGDLEFKALGPRAGVYAEPGQVAEAHEEFSEIETMMDAAEALYGTYSWGRYDILVLPPSFPFGGMENPRLTFATPTIIAGDKSLVSLIAHELAHSWSGNLVTNATWNDFWLNEGFTVYFENRIMEAYKGKAYANMLAVLGYRELLGTIEDLGPNSEDTKLKLDLEGRDPDDGMTDIAYEKGFSFLRTIERVWGRNNFDAFLMKYFQDNKFQSVTTETFLNKLEQSMGPASYEKINAEQWVYQAGLPDGYVAPVSKRFALVDSLVKTQGPLKIDKSITQDWTTHEWISYIQKIPDADAKELMSKIDEKYQLSASGNAEILCVWYEKAIKNGYVKVDEGVQDFLIKVGRRKFLVPLYEALVSKGREDFAKEIYREARSGYHAVSVQTIDKILSFNI